MLKKPLGKYQCSCQNINVGRRRQPGQQDCSSQQSWTGTWYLRWKVAELVTTEPDKTNSQENWGLWSTFFVSGSGGIGRPHRLRVCLLWRLDDKVSCWKKEDFWKYKWCFMASNLLTLRNIDKPFIDDQEFDRVIAEWLWRKSYWSTNHLYCLIAHFEEDTAS